jgi:hypothetical protein
MSLTGQSKGLLEASLQDRSRTSLYSADVYNATNSSGFKQVIACLVPLDHALAHQTHASEEYGAHTIKKLRESGILALSSRGRRVRG